MLARLNLFINISSGSKNCITPIPKENVHHQFGTMFGTDYIEQLSRTPEKYSIDKYEIPQYREVIKQCIPPNSHVHVST